MNKRIKAMLLILMLMLSFTMTACKRTETPFANKDGSILTYKDIESLGDGYYVVKANGNINPLLSQGIQGNNRADSLVWYRDFDKLVPVFEEGDSIIIVRSSGFENNQPAKFVKMRDSGWTIGGTFQTSLLRTADGEVKSRIAFAGNYCPYSQAGAAVEAVMGGNSGAALLDINGKEFTPNMLSSNGILQGLTRDAMYQFRYYVGTKYKFINMKADTHVFEGEREFTSKEFIEEKSTYFTVPIPDGLEKGFYILNGYGMFFYNAGEFTTD